MQIKKKHSLFYDCGAAKADSGLNKKMKVKTIGQNVVLVLLPRNHHHLMKYKAIETKDT